MSKLVENILKEGMPGDETPKGFAGREIDLENKESFDKPQAWNFYRLEYKDTHISPFRFPESMMNKLTNWEKEIINGSLRCLNSSLTAHLIKNIPEGYVFGFLEKKIF